MPAPHVSTAFGDLLDPRFQKIFYEEYQQLPDMVGKLFSDVSNTNGRNNMTWSNVGTLRDFTEFNGTVGYHVAEPRLQHDSDAGRVRERHPGRAQALRRRPVPHHGPEAAGACPVGFPHAPEACSPALNNAFSVDNYFYVNSEGVALCSDSHTTTSGASTATGFSNKVTSALTAT
jgi:hypothetical protein